MSRSSFNIRLKEGIKQRRITQAKISQQTGIDKGALSHYVKGDFKPKQNNVSKLAIVLNVNEAWLMGYDVPMDRLSDEELEKQETRIELINIINSLDDDDLKKIKMLVVALFSK